MHAPPTIDAAAIGERLRELRSRRGLTQRAVAQRVGYTEAALSNVEQGKTVPGSQLVLSLAWLYDTTVEYLLTGEDTRAVSASVPDDLLEQVERYLADPIGASASSAMAERLRDTSLWASHRFSSVDFGTIHQMRCLLEAAQAAAIRARERSEPPAPKTLKRTAR